MAGRIRSVKPELISTPEFATLSDAAARLYYGLLGVVDDCGRCPAAASFLAGQIFWGRQRPLAAIGRLVAELEHASIVQTYASGGATYLQIVGWSVKGSVAYQRVDKHQGEKFPAPSSIGSTNDSRRHSSSDSTPDPIRSERKGEDLPRAASIPGITPVPEPSGTAEERDRAARAKIRARAFEHLNKLRQDVGAELGQHARPLHPQDPGERALADRQRDGASEADIVHVLDLAAAEARTEGTVRWLTGSLFEEKQWRRLLGMTIEDAQKPRVGPKGSTPAPLRLVLAAPDDDMPDLGNSPWAPRGKKGTGS